MKQSSWMSSYVWQEWVKHPVASGLVGSWALRWHIMWSRGRSLSKGTVSGTMATLQLSCQHFFTDFWHKGNENLSLRNVLATIVRNNVAWDACVDDPVHSCHDTLSSRLSGIFPGQRPAPSSVALITPIFTNCANIPKIRYPNVLIPLSPLARIELIDLRFQNY